MRDKVIIFIDTVAEKNKLQVEAINECNLKAHFFAYHINKKSEVFLSPNHLQKKLSKNPLKQVFDVFNHIRKHAGSIHHLEIYPGSILSFYYVLTGKLFGLKTICAERGDIHHYHPKGNDKLTRMSMGICYKYSDIVWYREPFMEPILKKISSKRLFFLHNSVYIHPERIIPPAEKSIDFIWLNRVIPTRRSDWFIEILKNDLFKKTRNLFIGTLPNSLYQKEQEYIRVNQTSNITVRDYLANPRDFLKSSKFFVMPAEFTFANHALLEAMSLGTIPLISDQKGSELIVENGVSGFIFPHSLEGLEAAMERVMNMDQMALEKMSMAAREKIISDFSKEKYIRGLKELYELIEKNPKVK